MQFVPLLRPSRPAKAKAPFAGPEGFGNWCCMALVLALPLATGRIPGSSQLLALLAEPGQHNLNPTALFQSPVAAAAVTPVPVVAGEGPYRITPERRALLNTIRFAEGTWSGGSHKGYQMLFGGGQFANLARHPELTVSRGYQSAAAGAYQFLPDTWMEASKHLRLRDFRPASQDQAALYLVEKRGALARFDRQGLNHEVIGLLSPEWASLPTTAGGSYYGQPVKAHNELLRFYANELARQRTLGLV